MFSVFKARERPFVLNVTRAFSQRFSQAILSGYFWPETFRTLKGCYNFFNFMPRYSKSHIYPVFSRCSGLPRAHHALENFRQLRRTRILRKDVRVLNRVETIEANGNGRIRYRMEEEDEPCAPGTSAWSSEIEKKCNKYLGNSLVIPPSGQISIYCFTILLAYGRFLPIPSLSLFPLGVCVCSILLLYLSLAYFSFLWGGDGEWAI